MLDSGVIEPTVSEWSSPLVVVQKKYGGVRLCRLSSAEQTLDF